MNTRRKRIVVVAIAIFFLFSLLIAHYYKLQIIENEKWAKEARGQHQRIVLEPFKRGSFFSNTEIKQGHPVLNQPFVFDVQAFHLYIDPSQIPEFAKSEIADYLKEVLDIPKSDWSEFRSEFDRKSRSRKLAMWLDFSTRSVIQNWWEGYARKEKILKNSLFFIDDYRRSYPFKRLLGQVLHTIRENKDEKTKEGLPTGGLELQFNHLLKGKQGKRLLVHSPRNPLELGSVIEDPEDGADIYLTVNHCLQAICEEEIEKGVKRAKAKSGWAVMMDPFTGQILAMAQYPFFEPACYREYFNDPSKIEQTKVRAITDANEIGSVMKPCTLAICLQANKELKKQGKPPLFTLEEKIATSNGNFPGRRKPIRDTHLHYNLNAYLAIQKSSNIYMGRLVERLVKTLGIEWYRNSLEKFFCFGIKTGIELPGEVPGLLPRIGRKHPNGTLEWSVPTPYSIAMGHNIQATSLQILCAHAIFANGGYAVKPTLVKKIVKKTRDGKEIVLLDNTIKKELVKVFDSDIVDTVVRAMKATTKVGGTARKADIWGYTEAGKTGTAEKIVNGTYSKVDFFSSFIGFSPVKNPRFVLLVAIDEPEPVYIPGVGKNSQGGTCAALVFRGIGTRALEYLGVTPDDPYGYPVGDPRYNAEKADWSSELKELKILYEKWNSKEAS
ncbi:MAG: penicillin-binding protein 2 [Chlamydiales bacterium]|nr:penicillin-binding protein 2 [Chlamydiales bacterium]